jgi:dTDP-4-dehydrorhamnose reductase
MRKMTPSRRILVTGASGLLGRSLKGRLEGVGTVTGTGHSQTVAGLVPVDLRDAGALEYLLNEVNPDVVVHSAAYRDPDYCEEHPEEAFRLNVAPVETFCELLPGSVPLLFISSDYVFDGITPPYREEDERCPVNEYGRLKVGAEDLVLQRETGLVLRIPLLIGAGPTWETSGFIFKTLAQIQDPAPSTLDHVGIRFPTWTEDVAEAVVHILGSGGGGIYHFSSLAGGTKYEWAVELAGLTGLSMEHIAPAGECSVSGAPRPGNTQLAVEKVRQTGFSRFTPFRDVVKSVFRQFSITGFRGLEQR